MAARRKRANLPPDPKGVGDLAGYLARFGRAAETAEALNLCEEFLGHYAGPGGGAPHGFTLVGPYGTGKTTAAAALARALFARAVDVRWENGPALYNRLVGALRAGSFDEDLGALMRAPVLFLDDLGREKPSPWWIDQALFPLVDARYQGSKPTVCTTNKTWRELEAKYAGARSERGELADSAGALCDRLEEWCPAVEFGGPDSQRMPRWELGGGQG